MMQNLDPNNWPETIELAHQMLDEMFEFIQKQASGKDKVWQAIPTKTKNRIYEPLPTKGEGLFKAYAAFKEHVLPYGIGNLHPRFFGWVVGNGTVTGMLAEMLAAGMNPHLAGFNQSPQHIERVVIEWVAELLGFPKDSSGLLLSGASMGNLNALAVARQKKAGHNVRKWGNHGQKFTVYGSDQTHGWVYKACALMGLGERAFRPVATEKGFQMDLQACSEMIAWDIQEGCIPLCLIGSAGTVNTGSIDDFLAMRRLADEFGLWFHIDGALGSLAAIHPKTAHLVQGQELADSIAFDFHKWGYLPFEIGGVLVRDGQAHHQTFAQAPSYLAPSNRGVSVGTTFFADKGYELSRGFKALKLWMSLKEVGSSALGEVIRKNIEQAGYLADLARDEANWELAVNPRLNIVCVRFVGAKHEELDAINEEIVLRLQEEGTAVPSQCRLEGHFYIRICIANHRTSYEDLDMLFRRMKDLANDLVVQKPLSV